MIKLELEIDDIDYNMLITKYLPQLTENLRQTNNPVAMLLSNGMSASVAKMIIGGFSKEKKDQLAAELINSNKQQIINFVEEAAKKQDVGLSVKNVSACAPDRK